MLGLKYPTAFVLSLLSLTPTNVRAEPNPARITYPQEQQTLHYLDTIAVAYESDFPSPWLHTWCEVDGVPQEKSRTQVNGFSSSALVKLNFEGGGDPCWFQLSSREEDASDEAKSLPFTYVEGKRVRTTTLANQAGPGSNAIGNNDLSVKSETNNSSTAGDCGMEATKMNSVSVRDMLGMHVGIGAGAAVAGIAFGSLISILCIRLRRKTPAEESKLESSGIGRSTGGRDSPQSTVFSPDNPLTDVSPKREHEAPRSQSPRRHRQRRQIDEVVLPIYPDESASCYNPDTDDDYQLAKAYATDFAMADRQIWTDHLQSQVPGETPVVSPLSHQSRVPGETPVVVSPLSASWIVREIPRLNSGTTMNEPAGADRVPSRRHRVPYEAAGGV
ncbi:hypothetical protein GGR53DRAFT_463778 [Hypoxylon sp. FL1150]|nr:hypothetical protein GGR53DRAFT_463778 [Hypoxylon sp. FL1150]